MADLIGSGRSIAAATTAMQLMAAPASRLGTSVQGMHASSSKAETPRMIDGDEMMMMMMIRLLLSLLWLWLVVGG